MRKRLGEVGATLRSFWRQNEGQNLVEHSLLLAFVALAAATLFIGAGNSVKGIWSTSSSQLSVANTCAS